MKKRAFIYIIIAGILWGTSGIFVNVLSPYGFSSIQLTALRGAVSFVCMAIYILMRNRRLLRIKPMDILLFAGIGVSLFGTGGCYFISMQMTSISTAVVLMYMAPVYVMIFSVLVLAEKFSKLKLVSVLCMLIGCCLVSGIVGGLKFDGLGILMGVLSGISYGSYNILTKIAMRRKCAPVSTTLYSFLFMAVIALSVSRPQEMISYVKPEPWLTIPLILALGIVTFVLPYLLYTLALKELPAGTASALGIVEPMAATVFSVVIFREALSVYSVVGIVLILLAVFLLGKAEDKQ